MRKWVRTFLSDLAFKRKLSANTEAGYASDLAHFADYAEAAGVAEPRALKAGLIAAYLEDLRAQGRSNATIARRVVSIRAFCHYLTIKRIVDYNPAIQLEAPKPEPKPPRTIAAVDLERLLELPDVRTEYGLRDRAMLELLYATGLRASELIALDTGHVRPKMGFLLCLGTGGKERMVPFGAQAAYWLARYMEEALPGMRGDEERGDALFVNHLGARLTRQGFWKVVKRYGAAAGMDIAPHMFRHSFAAHLLDNGADVRAVQEMLGHVGAQATFAYGKGAKVKVKEEYDRNHPRARGRTPSIQAEESGTDDV